MPGQLRCKVLPFLGALPLLVAHREGQLDESVNLNDYQRTDLCHIDVVEDACSRLRELQEGDADETSLQMAVELALSAESLSSFWEALDLHDESVDCQRLCLEAVKYIGSNGVLPAKNDYACYNVGMETICDAYVGDDILHTFGPAEDKDIPDLHDDEVIKETEKQISNAEASNGTSSFLQKAVSLANLHADNVVYSNWEAAERIANFFHIYPVQHPEQDPEAEAEEEEEEEAQQAPARDLEEDAKSLLEKNAVPWNLGKWPSGGAQRTTQRKIAEAKSYVNAAIEHFERRATCTQMDRWFGSDTYHNEVHRNEVRRIMNSVRHMLGNIEIFPIGPSCQSNTYAYVYPKAYDCTHRSQMKDIACTKINGKYVFYVCDLYFNRPAEMIETLVHEGSHHATAYTDDVEYHGQKAYGRPACKTLAGKYGDHVKARKNADSFCYYIQDVATQLGTKAQRYSACPTRQVTSHAVNSRPHQSHEVGTTRRRSQSYQSYPVRTTSSPQPSQDLCFKCARFPNACSIYPDSCGRCPSCTNASDVYSRRRRETTTTKYPAYYSTTYSAPTRRRSYYSAPTPSPARCPSGSKLGRDGNCKCGTRKRGRVYDWCYTTTVQYGAGGSVGYKKNLGCYDNQGSFESRSFDPKCKNCRCDGALWQPSDTFKFGSAYKYIETVIVNMRTSKSKIFSDGVERRCCCQNINETQSCELIVEDPSKGGCGQKGPHWHSWNNMNSGWDSVTNLFSFNKVSKIENYGKCAIPV